MKPTISIVLIALGLTFPAPALAAPTHLTCTETKSNDGKLWKQQVLIDADRGYASVDSTEMPLIVGPTELVLEKSEVAQDFLVHRIWINRQTLAFRREWTFWPYKDSSFESERKTSGQCRITPAPAGRQI